MAMPKTVTMQWMVLFSHLTVQRPSVLAFHTHELVACSAAPAFCISTQVTVRKIGIRDGFPSGASTNDVHIIFGYFDPPFVLFWN